MSEHSYILNHWLTVVWLGLAALYTFYAVIAEAVKMMRNGGKPKDSDKPKR